MTAETKKTTSKGTTTKTIKNVHEAIVHVMNQVGYVQKQDAEGLPYSFASEAAFIKAVRPHMVDVGLFVYQSGAEEIVTETFLTSNTKTAHKRIFKFAYTFVHAPTLSEIQVTAIGEGDDFSDKGSNKAMTVALKYVLRQTLLIETGDDPDETSSTVFEAETLGGVTWTEEYTSAMIAVNPNATMAEAASALRIFCEVTGWNEKTDAIDFRFLAEKYAKQKAIMEQDGLNIGFRELVSMAFDEYRKEID